MSLEDPEIEEHQKKHILSSKGAPEGWRPEEEKEVLSVIEELLHETKPVARVSLIRLLRGLHTITSSASSASLSSAASASTDVGVIYRLLGDPALILADEPAVGPLAAARLRGAAIKRKLLEHGGGYWSVSQVAECLHISTQAVHKRRKSGALFAVHLGGTRYVYPAWQFCEDGETLPGLNDILASFAVEDPWTRMSFFLTADPRLQGRTPLDVLREGDIDAVRVAARAYGEHGAP